MDALVHRYERYQRQAAWLNRGVVAYFIGLIWLITVVPQALALAWVFIAVGFLSAAFYLWLLRQGVLLAKELRGYESPEKRKQNEGVVFTLGDDGELVPMDGEVGKHAGRSV